MYWLHFLIFQACERICFELMQIEASVAIFVLSLGLGVLQAGVLTKVELLLSMILVVSILSLVLGAHQAHQMSFAIHTLDLQLHMQLRQIEHSTKAMEKRLMYENFQGADLVTDLSSAR